jgi:predicted permease
MMDAVRMLPLLCLLLWLVVPTMLPNATQDGEHTALSSALWYVFLIWVLAILASFALWRRIRRFDKAADPQSQTVGSAGAAGSAASGASDP